MGSPEASTEGALERLLADPTLEGRIVHVEHLPARAAETAPTAQPLCAATAAALARGGITELWAHQARAVDLVRSGRSVVVSTGTASGKSLAYLVPTLESVLGDGPPATMLAVYPTKALARDQLRRIRALAGANVAAAVVDGDTPREDREWARKNAHVILTNPDMLHQTILPNHHRWVPFLSRLGLVALDEIHTLRGIFGSHVAHVVRRLRRVGTHYGASPVFVCTTATLGNPRDLARSLTGVPVSVVSDDSSPAPPRNVVLWNPPLVDPDRGIRQSPLGESGRLMARLVEEGLQTLVFTRSRRATEMVARIAREALPRNLARHVMAYRGGFLAEERREIEDAIADGSLRGVAATTALELGMDIGGLDAVVLCGFPGTVASFRQQMGRAGRGDRAAMGVLVAGQDQLDQWYLSNPAQLFGGKVESAVVNPSNRRIDLPHLACAASELPIHRDDRLLGDDLDVRPAPLLADGTLQMRRGRLHYRGRSPARLVPLRSSAGDSLAIVDERSGRTVGTVDSGRACRLVHPGAIYLHQGESWLVHDLDLDDRVATAEPFECDFYTQPRSRTDVEVLTEDDTLELADDVTVSIGTVLVTSQVTGFRRRLYDSPENFGTPEKLDLPAQQLETRAFWYVVAEDVLSAAGVDAGRTPGVVHACEHACIGILPRFAMCDRWDLGGVSTPLHPQTGAPCWFVYDGYPGGAGIAEVAFTRAVELAAATLDVIDACACRDGCPACVQSPKCGNWNEPLDKGGAAALLAHVVGTSARRHAVPPNSARPHALTARARAEV